MAVGVVSAERLGELAALGTAALWTGSYLAFAFAVRRIGADTLNRLRLLMALALLVLAHWIVEGTPIPSAEPSRWLWLSLAGVVGFAIADAFLFRALYHLGAHRTSMVTALVPVASALLAWIAFGERLRWVEALAGLGVVAGILLVLSGRREPDPTATTRSAKLGVLFALGTVAAQSTRYLFSVQGMRGGFPPLSTNVLQILAATAGAWGVAVGRKGWARTLGALRDRRAAAATAAGAVVGPFLGVTLSLVALSSAPMGIASTLMAMTPVFHLPASAVALRERVTWQAAGGTVLAVAGVAALFLV